MRTDMSIPLNVRVSVLTNYNNVKWIVSQHSWLMWPIEECQTNQEVSWTISNSSPLTDYKRSFREAVNCKIKNYYTIHADTKWMDGEWMLHGACIVRCELQCSIFESYQNCASRFGNLDKNYFVFKILLHFVQWTQTKILPFEKQSLFLSHSYFLLCIHLCVPSFYPLLPNLCFTSLSHVNHEVWWFGNNLLIP